MPDPALADLVVDIAHDIRTPLTSIRGFTDVLIRGGEQISEADRASYLERIKAAAASLDELITTLSEAAKASQATSG